MVGTECQHKNRWPEYIVIGISRKTKADNKFTKHFSP